MNYTHAKVKVTQSCPTLCDPMDYTIHGILQARILKWVAVPFPRDFLNPGIEPRSPTLQVDSLAAEPQESPNRTIVVKGFMIWIWVLKLLIFLEKQNITTPLCTFCSAT